MGEVAYCEVWEHHTNTAFFIFTSGTALVCLYVCARVSPHEHEGQRITFETWFSLTTMCVTSIKFGSSCFSASTFSCWAILPIPQSFYHHILIMYNNGFQYDVSMLTWIFSGGWSLSSQLVPKSLWLSCLFLCMWDSVSCPEAPLLLELCSLPSSPVSGTQCLWGWLLDTRPMLNKA